MPTTIINDILDPIGNRAANKPKPTLYGRYVNMYRCYDVQIEWLHNDEKQHSLQQEITMHCRDVQNEKAIWKIDKQQFLINEHSSENAMDELSIACTKQLYPIQLLVDKSGSLERIVNIAEIQQRFAAAKPILLRDFDGSIAEQYVHQIEETLCHPNYLLTNIQKEKWLSLFFTPIYTQYDPETFKANIQVEFPFYDFEQPLIFTTEATIDFKPTDEETYTLTCQGKLDIKQQLSTVVQHRYGPIEGSIHIIYDVDQHKHQIQNITGEVTIQTDNGTSQITISGHTLHSEEKIEPLPINQEKKKTSWWSSLFGN